MRCFVDEATLAQIDASQAAAVADGVVMNVRMVGAMIRQIEHGIKEAASGTAESAEKAFETPFAPEAAKTRSSGKTMRERKRRASPGC